MNEAHFAWDAIDVGPDDRTLELRGIHPPLVWSSEDSWWAFSRVEVLEEPDAVGLRLWQLEREPGEPGARRVDDPDQTAEVVLITLSRPSTRSTGA